MQYHITQLFNNTSVKRLLLSIFIIIAFSFNVKAQYDTSDSRYGLSIGSDYDAPVGNFAYTFKPATNYNLNLLHHYDNFTTSISFGYHVYKPKLDTFYYQVTNTDYGTIHYQNFPVYSLYLGAVYDLKLTDKFKAYAGINFGIYFTHLKYNSSDFLSVNNVDVNDQDIYLAPRLGFTFMITNNVGIGIEGKYNFFAPTGETTDNDRVGTLYNSFSAGVRLTYDF